MSKLLYYNTKKLTLSIAKREKVRIPIWLISIITITLMVANVFRDLYSSDAERQAIAETMKNPAMIAMVGPGYSLNNYTIGAMMGQQMLLFTALAVGIMSILLVTSHTRADEENGRIEVIRSLPVGRLAYLSATGLVLVLANIILALLIGIGLFALGIDSIDFGGSILYGATLGVIGIFFASITSLFAQLTENSRSTMGYSFTFLFGAYLIRAIGDVSSETISWLSPLGWILRTQVYVNNYWWPLLITITVSLAIFALSLYLNSIRDLEAGFIPTKPGKSHASKYLLSPLGLTFRLQRTGIIIWIIGMYILGASYGSVLGDIEIFFNDNELIKQILPKALGYTLTEQFVTMLLTVISMICTIPALLSILKLRSEEKKKRTENILGRSVSRHNILGSHLLVAFLVGFIALFSAVLGLWSASALVMEEPIAFSRYFISAIVYLPAMWVLIGVATVLIGFLPSFTNCSWLYLGFSFFVVYLGGLLKISEAVKKLSPFGIVPRLPIDEMNYFKIFGLIFLALTLIILGFYGYRNRDIQG